MQITRKQLHNKLNIVLVDTGSFPSCTALLLVGTGSRYETKQNNGIAHFFEHMAFKGSKKYSDAYVLASTIENFGGVFNAFTSKEYTGYWIKAPLQHVRTVIDVIADMVQHPILAEAEIEREKGVIIEEINMYEDTPQDKVGELYESLLYPHNALGYDTIGTKETVRAATRDTFSDFIDTHYHPNNAVCILAGGLTKEPYNNIVEDTFGSWRKAKVPTFVLFKDNQKKHQVRSIVKKTEQSHLVFGYRAFNRYDVRRYPLSILSALLGGGMASRLFHELRERRGLCYYIGTSQELYQDTGSLYTRAGVPTAKEKVCEAIDTIREEHYRIRDKGPSDSELTRAKELIKGHLLLSLEDSFDTAYFVGKQALFEKEIDTPKAVLKKIDAVTADDVKSVARDIIHEEKENIAFIGPVAVPED
ncbi:hypothetical protein COU89_03560 [Candidatus Roizmanbacteria bacterium CG10_big_fil_rev_8_21_14_0_10_45_7]|uniref:Peptidase M16 n=1 Tax=Candidatus Roizmanbacteria bacterium CG10_big_fil_rev_8_21_14_0_10_45_7 TaxID=1974854 RepID=A0A2M8KTY8_9BACT|nr:MAG: hypothetical protein COU89_03560 [Candidatus Roizmanbacteria bacterium CG10_big_fil_rev_8_21_14_0_10_45_7]